jgi:hypothetical protein
MPRALLKDARSAIILIVETNFSESSQMEGRREMGGGRTIWRAGARWGAKEHYGGRREVGGGRGGNRQVVGEIARDC